MGVPWGTLSLGGRKCFAGCLLWVSSKLGIRHKNVEECISVVLHLGACKCVCRSPRCEGSQVITDYCTSQYLMLDSGKLLICEACTLMWTWVLCEGTWSPQADWRLSATPGFFKITEFPAGKCQCKMTYGQLQCMVRCMIRKHYQLMLPQAIPDLVMPSSFKLYISNTQYQWGDELECLYFVSIEEAIFLLHKAW